MGPLQLQWTVYTTLLIVMAVVALVSTFYARRRRKVPWIGAGVGLLVSGAVWCAAYAFELANTGLQAKVLWNSVAYTTICAIPWLWVIIALQYVGQGKWLTTRRRLLLSIPSAIIVLLIWTNDLHRLMWTDASLRTVVHLGTRYADLVRTEGPAYWVLMTLIFGAIVTSAFLFAQTLLRSLHIYSWQVIILFVVMVSLALDGIVEITTAIFPNYIPLTFTVCALALVWGMSYIRTGDLVSVSRRLILEDLVDPIMVLDEEDHVVNLNAACRRLIAPFHTRPLGRKVQEAWPAWVEQLGELSGTEEVRKEVVLGQSGQDVYDVRVSPVLDWNGRLVGRVAAMRDITDLKRAEREKQALQAQLMQARKMEAIGTLAGGIAHDFNNLLTAIQGNATLARSVLDPSDTAFDDVREIELACRRASRLTNQLLLFSRKRAIEPVPLDLNAMVNDLTEMLNRLIGEDIEISTSLAEDLWLVEADRGGIEQVITNLVVNARDAIPHGGKIVVTTGNVVLEEVDPEAIPEASPGKYACISVTDTGVGMDREVLEHIFEPFFSTKSVDQGTGLGLAVVYSIVSQHEGWIRVESEVNRGSTFSIHIPAVFGVSVPEPTTRTVSLSSLQGRGERILFVEDEKSVREYASRVLGQNGYEVLSAPDVRTAIETLERVQWRVDLVLSDVVLPDQTGLELADQILSHENPPGILLSSGYTGKRSQWETIRDRKLAFLQKPYSLTDLLSAVREALS